MSKEKTILTFSEFEGAGDNISFYEVEGTVTGVKITKRWFDYQVLPEGEEKEYVLFLSVAAASRLAKALEYVRAGW